MEHFAAQCGYCTPGMLISAKALLDRNPAPDARGRGRGDLGQHLPLHGLRADHRGRPGGRTSAKGRDAMIEFRKEFFADERDDTLNEIGKPTRRQDILGHVTGRSPFFDDHLFDGLLHVRCVRSPHHHARIRRIDTAEAQAHARRRAGADRSRRAAQPQHAPEPARFRHRRRAAAGGDQGRLQGRAGRRHHRRDRGASARGRGEGACRLGCAARTCSTSKRRSGRARPSCDEVYPTNKFIYHGKYDHQKLRYGDVEAAFARADHIVEGRYQMSPIEQAPIETCGAIAAPEVNDRFVCYTSTQALFFSLGTAAKTLTMPSNRLHFIGGTVGGGFGGKVDSVHEPIAILGAMLTGRPCKFAWDREEEMQVGAPRGAERWYIKDGVIPRRPHPRAQVHRLLRQRRLYPAVVLRDHQGRRPPARPLHDPQRARRRLLRLHQPDAGHRHARVRHHRRRLRHRSAHGQGGGRCRDEPDRAAHPQRLPRRRHEGPSPRGQELRADRVLPGGGREGRRGPAGHVRAQASSLRDGGGERGRLPARTALDQHGVRDRHRHRQAMPARPELRGGRAGRSQCRVTRCRLLRARVELLRSRLPDKRQRRASSQSADAEPPRPRTGPENRPRQGAMRFSSISGFRRR